MRLDTAVVAWILTAHRDDFANFVVMDGSLDTVTVLVSMAAESAETVRGSLQLERVEFGESEESDNTPVLKEDVVVSATPDVGLFGLGQKAAAVVWVKKKAGVGLGSGFWGILTEVFRLQLDYIGINPMER